MSNRISARDVLAYYAKLFTGMPICCTAYYLSRTAKTAEKNRKITGAYNSIINTRRDDRGVELSIFFYRVPDKRKNASDDRSPVE